MNFPEHPPGRSDASRPGADPAQPCAALPGAAQACPGGVKVLAATDAVRWRDGFVDAAFPAVPLPSRRVFEQAGAACLTRLVARHHERLRDSALAHLFPRDPREFSELVAASTAYFLEATGGPQTYSPGHISTCMRSRHFAITIDEAGREIWLAELLLSLDEVAFPARVRGEFWAWVEAMSLRVINRRSQRDAPRRHPLEEAHASLRHAMGTRRRPVLCPR